MHRINVQMGGATNMQKGIFSAAELGAKIRATRLAFRQTQEDVASRVGCRRQTVADVEKGRNVELYTVMAILSALGKGLEVVDAHVDVDRLAELFGDD